MNYLHGVMVEWGVDDWATLASREPAVQVFTPVAQWQSGPYGRERGWDNSQ